MSGKPRIVVVGIVTVALGVAGVAAAGGPAAGAQGTGGGAKGAATNVSGALDYAGRQFSLAPGAPPIERILEPKDLKKVLDAKIARRAYSVKYSAVFYGLKPCPDVHGTAHAEGTVEFSVLDRGGAEIWLTQVALYQVDVAVNDNAEIANVTLKGQFTGSPSNTNSTAGSYGGEFEYDRAGDQLDAKATGAGASKPGSQQRADTIGKHTASLADAIAKKLAAVWQDGTTCVTLGVTPASRSVKPQDTLSIEVTASAKEDGTKITRPITSKLKGVTSLEPATSKSAPGSFKYTAPTKKGDKGHVTFEQRSKRGIGRAEADYVASEKWKVDLSVNKVTLGCRDEPFCDESATLTQLSATIELGADGAGTGSGNAMLFVSEQRRLIPSGRCSVANLYPVPMTISVKTDGGTLWVSAQSNPKATIQECGLDGPENHTFDLVFPPVSVPASGGSNSRISTTDGCFTGGGEFDVRCTFTVTATMAED
jgi:hypothetical protein